MTGRSDVAANSIGHTEGMEFVQPPSIQFFRTFLRTLLTREAEATKPRDIVVFGLDGIKFGLARSVWCNASVTLYTSVYPTTSSTAWLTSLTGLGPEDHGIPGVVFTDDCGQLINVFQHTGKLRSPIIRNIFTDGAELGFRSIAIMGDWEPFDCTWRDLLLAHAHAVRGYRFYTADVPLAPRQIAGTIAEAVAEARRKRVTNEPLLIWCFVDIDRHIHYSGYDSEVIDLLGEIERLAVQMVEDNTLVVAHSDHGLTLTNHSESIAAALKDAQDRFNCRSGGCGRTRWFYSDYRDRSALIGTLQETLPESVRIFVPESVFAPHSLSTSRIGDVMLMAEGHEFVTFAGQKFDHGSRTADEIEVPIAIWGK